MSYPASLRRRLVEALESGLTLAEVAEASGLSVPDVRDALPDGWHLVAGRLVSSSPSTGASPVVGPATLPDGPAGGAEHIDPVGGDEEVEDDGLDDEDPWWGDDDTDEEDDMEHAAPTDPEVDPMEWPPKAEEGETMTTQRNRSERNAAISAARRERTDAAVLEVLAEAGAEGMAPSAIAESAGVDRATVTAAAKRLELPVTGYSRARRYYHPDHAPRARVVAEAEPAPTCVDCGGVIPAPDSPCACSPGGDEARPAHYDALRARIERLVQGAGDVRDRLARALGYVDPDGDRRPWSVDELIDAAGALASEVERLRQQAARPDLALLGELAERLGSSMSLDATVHDHAEAIRDGLDEADRERAVLAQHRDRLRAALERTGKHLGIDDAEHMEPYRLADQVEAAAWSRRRDDNLDAARLVLRGGLATGDHELAMTLALRVLEGR